MKVFAQNISVFAGVFAFVLSFCGAARSREVPEPDVGASASNAGDRSFPGKAGARMEIEIKGVKTAFRWAPPGSFTRRWNGRTAIFWEKPTDGEQDFEITLTRGFWLAETETTQELWQTVMWSYNPSKGVRTERAPVNNVSWDETQEFIARLNCDGYAPGGFEFRLPTEAQWEYACMAGSTDERCGELDAIAWYGANSEGRAHEVGLKQANAWGLYDMLGNVWEWCGDRYGKYPMGDITDYAGPQEGSYRVSRGGGWDDSAERCGRSCRAYWSGRSFWNGGDGRLGFRLALVPKER